MNKKSWMVGLWVVVIGALVGAKSFLSMNKKPQSEKPNAPPVERPSIKNAASFYKKGDPATLTFSKIDLGAASSVKLSDNGDLLYRWHDDHKLGKPVYRLRHHDGSMTDFPDAKKVFLTPQGKVLALFGDKGNFRLDLNGATIFNATSSVNGRAISDALQSIEAVTDEGIFVRTGEAGVISYLTFEMKLKPITLPANTSILGIRSSPDLGTFFSLSQKDEHDENGPSYSLAKFKEGSIEPLVLPLECPNPTMTLSRNHVYLVSSESAGNWSVVDYYNGAFELLPNIPNAAGATLLVSNSHHEFIYKTSEQMQAQHLGNQFQQTEYFVSDDKYYDLSKILYTLKIFSNGMQNLSLNNEYRITQEGNIVVNTHKAAGDHLYLLQRSH